MQASKAIGIGTVILLVLIVGLFGFVPSTRPAFVKSWIRQATGFGPAKTPEEALDRFKRSLEKRDFETAALFCGGDCRDFMEKGAADARLLGLELDNLRAAVKVHGVKSDKSEVVLFLLDPLPPTFKVESVTKNGDNPASAVLNWGEDAARLAGSVSQVNDLKINSLAYYCLLSKNPIHSPLPVQLVLDKDRSWKVVLPTQVGSFRHLRESVDYLNRNGTNVRNALEALKTDVKNDPSSREKLGYENSLRSKLEDATR